MFDTLGFGCRHDGDVSGDLCRSTAVGTWEPFAIKGN